MSADRELPVRRRLAIATLAILSTGFFAACGPMTPPGPGYPPDRAEYWRQIGACEQPGNGWGGVAWDHPGPTYQGGLGFWYGTWDSYKPDGYPADAGQASPEQQMIVADIVYDAVGARAWGCSARVGLRP